MNQDVSFINTLNYIDKIDFFKNDEIRFKEFFKEKRIKLFELCEMKEEEVRKIPTLKDKEVALLKEFLKKHNLHLGMTHKESLEYIKSKYFNSQN